MLTSLNMAIFIIYVVAVVRTQQSEKERILVLNEKLNAANDELKRANIQLEEYAKESEKAAETRERNRLAREIHDTLGHSFVGIITGIEACAALMDVAPDATKVQLMAIAEVARQGMTDVRRSVKALRPDALEKLNLEKALTQMVTEIRTATSAEILYQCTADLNCFNEDEEDIIYRIVQESITNSIRHGKAKKIEIFIDREYNMLNLLIKDNGTGCSDIQKGFGLHHMDERLGMLGGSLEYSGENGFTVKAQIPIRWGNEKND
ncbi:MAG: sensor histidine kinase [Lachnospiraceae bacterium]|nr:sensor histidine kinase [Lachnospiraceae bacterium]